MRVMIAALLLFAFGCSKGNSEVRYIESPEVRYNAIQKMIDTVEDEISQTVKIAATIQMMVSTEGKKIIFNGVEVADLTDSQIAKLSENDLKAYNTLKSCSETVRLHQQRIMDLRKRQAETGAAF